MSTDQQLEQVELSIDSAKEGIELKDALLRLIKNKDFTKIIDEGYFKEEASRLVLLKADPSMQEDKEQITIKKSIDAIGYFRLYLHTIMQRGVALERSLAADEETRQELLAETLQEM